MMKQIFLFTKSSIASQYGIGSYLNQLLSFLKEESTFDIYLIELYSEKEEFTVETHENIQQIYVPFIKARNGRQFRGEKDDHAYGKNVFYLLSPFINKQQKAIVHFNTFFDSDFVEQVKMFMPKSFVLSTIHYLNWSFVIKGNTVYFKSIIHSDSSKMTKTEQIIKELYEEEKKAFKLLDSIICLCDYMKDLLIHEYEIPAEKITVVRNGVKDVTLGVFSQSEVGQLREKLNIPLHTKVLLYAGRLETNKGIDYLIDAFRQLSVNFPDCLLILAGNGEIEDYLKKTFAFWHKIIITGKLEKEVLYQLYKIAEIGVLPSFHEQCSYTAIEMMMHGLPLIGTNSSGLREMIHTGKNGELVNIIEKANEVKIDTHDLIRKMEKFISQENLIEIKRKSYDIFKQYYSLEIMRKNYLQIYKGVSENP